LAWENTINCAIFLKTSHRFKDDPEYGEILERFRMGENTHEDREEINKRVISLTVKPPKDDQDLCYACPTNKERNGVNAITFQQHIKATHPKVTDEEDPPDHTLMIEASIWTKKKKDTAKNGDGRQRKRKRGANSSSKSRGRQVSQAVHDTIVTHLGDSDILSTDFNTQGAKIDPVLRVYPGCHQMCITNDDLSEGRGNGTLCKVVKVKLRKNGRERQWKNWEGHKVWTVSVEHVRWVEYEHFPKAPRGKPKRFRLYPKEFSAKISFPIDVTNDIRISIGNAAITQIPVNSNIATTGHKLQGMSKNTLIVNNWDYRCANWVYVVLSRVRTRKGLFLMKALDMNRDFSVPQKLLDFEARMKRFKEQPILDKLSRAGVYQASEDDVTPAE